MENQTKEEMSNQNWNNLEGAERALREIYMGCGNPDPSDGEVTGYDDIVKAVHSHLATLEQMKKALELYRKHAGRCMPHPQSGEHKPETCPNCVAAKALSATPPTSGWDKTG